MKVCLNKTLNNILHCQSYCCYKNITFVLCIWFLCNVRVGKKHIFDWIIAISKINFALIENPCTCRPVTTSNLKNWVWFRESVIFSQVYICLKVIVTYGYAIIYWSTLFSFVQYSLFASAIHFICKNELSILKVHAMYIFKLSCKRKKMCNWPQKRMAKNAFSKCLPFTNCKYIL